MLSLQKVYRGTSCGCCKYSNQCTSYIDCTFEALTGAVTTWVMDNLQQGNGKKLYHDSMFYISGLAVVAIGTILFAPEIVWILGEQNMHLPLH